MVYKLHIEDAVGTIDIIEEGIITKVDFKIFQNDKSANDRSEKLFHTITIEGVLTDKSQKETREILEWSKKTDKASVYKTVSIEVYNQEEKIRDYYMKDIFCVSYQEILDENRKNDGEFDSIGKFVLEMKQRSGSIKTIKVD